MAGYSSRFPRYLRTGRRSGWIRRNRLLLLGLWTVGVLYRPGDGGHLATAAARTVDRFLSQAGACGGHRLAGVDLDFRHRPGQSLFPVLRFRSGCRRLSLGSVGDRCHRRIRDFLLWLESLAFYLGFFGGVDRLLARYHLPLLGVQAADFEPKRLFMLSIYLLVMGLLLGYLAEQQKQLRSEKAVIARILGKVRVEAGLSGTLQEIVGELLVMYGAERALIASQESTGHRVYVGEMLLRNGEAPFSAGLIRRLPTGTRTCSTIRQKRLSRGPTVNENGNYTLLGLDHAGQKLPTAPAAFLDPLARQHVQTS